MSSSSREFKNRFTYTSSEKLLDDNGKLCEPIANDIRKGIDGMLEILYEGLTISNNDDDSVYTGSSGIALLNLKLHMSVAKGNDDSFLKTALKYLKRPLMRLKGRRKSFLCGDSGVLAIAAVVYYKLKQEKESQQCIYQLQEIHNYVFDDEELPNELLYGKIGYIYSLLFVQSYISKEVIDVNIIIKILKDIISSGHKLSEEENSFSPLMYTWHGKHYLGAAHGIVGIIHILLQFDKELIEPYLNDIQRCIKYLITLQLSSGNFPSSLENNHTDKLVHWCHGAPGWIHMLLKAYQIFNEHQFLLKAKQCSDVIWLRGLLKKGYGLCHGTAGNAYAFLAMYKTTQEDKYLHQAYMFALWCLDYGKHGCNIPDRPYSLFEGLAGTICFLIDMLEPMKYKFPAFDL